MGNDRPFDPSRNIRPSPESEASMFPCSDPTCPRCRGTGKYLVLDQPLTITSWIPIERPDRPVPIRRREVSCLIPPFEADFDSYLRSILIDSLRFPHHTDRMRGPGDPRSPEETRISRELRHFLDERR